MGTRNQALENFQTQQPEGGTISNELACSVVKSYLLPMFEGSHRRNTKLKHKRMIKQQTGSSNDIYQELKLTESLGEDIKKLKRKIMEQEERLQEVMYEAETYKEELKNLKIDYCTKVNETKALKVQLRSTQESLELILHKLNHTLQQSQLLTSLVMNSEESRQEYSIRLNQTRTELDEMKNKSQEFRESGKLSQIALKLIEEKLEMVFLSHHAISNAKKLDEQYEQKFNAQHETIQRLQTQLRDNEYARMHLRGKLDRREKELQLVCNSKMALEVDKVYAVMRQKMIITAKDKEIQDLKMKRDSALSEKRQREKESADLSAHNQHLQRQIQRIRAKKGKIDMGIKTCQHCRRDYTEQENFNWSCRIHPSEYSGEIWWCCGKADRHDAGCKFGKHVGQKDSDDELEENLMNPANNDPSMFNFRKRKCMCCKE